MRQKEKISGRLWKIENTSRDKRQTLTMVLKKRHGASEDYLNLLVADDGNNFREICFYQEVVI